MELSTIDEIDGYIENLEKQIESTIPKNGFTDLERISIITIETLKASLIVDYKNILVKGKIIEKIERMGLFLGPPNRYKTLEEMAKDCGMSLTQFYNIRTFYNDIYPYMLQSGLGDVYGYHISNIFDALPYLRMIITDEQSKSKKVRDSVNLLLKDINDIEDGLSKEEIKDVAIKRILQSCEGTNTMLRKSLSDTETEDIPTIIHNKNEYRYSVLKMDHDQYMMFQRLIGKHISVSVIDVLPFNIEALQL